MIVLATPPADLVPAPAGHVVTAAVLLDPVPALAAFAGVSPQPQLVSHALLQPTCLWHALAPLVPEVVKVAEGGAAVCALQVGTVCLAVCQLVALGAPALRQFGEGGRRKGEKKNNSAKNKHTHEKKKETK